jgi:hypothetical protein
MSLLLSAACVNKNKASAVTELQTRPESKDVPLSNNPALKELPEDTDIPEVVSPGFLPQGETVLRVLWVTLTRSR